MLFGERLPIDPPVVRLSCGCPDAAVGRHRDNAAGAGDFSSVDHVAVRIPGSADVFEPLGARLPLECCLYLWRKLRPAEDFSGRPIGG